MHDNEIIIKDKIALAIDETYWQSYSSMTTTLSNICRQLAFAEGGICWFFKTCSSQPFLLNNISSILKYLIYFFMADAAQYLIASTIYYLVAYYKSYQNKQGLIKNPREIKRGLLINLPSLGLFAAKIFILFKASRLIVDLLVQ